MPTDATIDQSRPMSRATRSSAPPAPELIEQARASDDDALERLIRLYQNRVAAMVRSLVGDTDPEWPDICQEIFVKMVLGLPRLKTVAVFEPWLLRIARNACYDHLRRRRSRRWMVPWEPHHDAVPAPSESGADAHSARLSQAIGRLPADQRELIELVRDRHWSYERLAQMTGQTLGALKSRLFRARQRLRQLMIEADHE